MSSIYVPREALEDTSFIKALRSTLGAGSTSILEDLCNSYTLEARRNRVANAAIKIDSLHSVCIQVLNR